MLFLHFLLFYFYVIIFYLKIAYKIPNLLQM